MFVKLTVLACLVVAALGDGKWYGPQAGGLPASLYPAGINPQSCPNYPNCNNPAVAATQSNHGAWNNGNNGAWNNGNNGAWNNHNNGAWNNDNNGAWNNDNGAWNNHNNGAWNNNGGQYNGGYEGGNGLDAGRYTGDGDYHGEGLAESGAYGDISQGYNNNGPSYNPGSAYNPANAYNPGAAAALPAGVSPHACPNYPFCK